MSVALTQTYRVADSVAPDASDKPVRNMLFLIAYDISDPRRLRRVAKTCEDFGFRVEKSVFECDIPPDDFDLLWAELQELIDKDQDALVAYRICAGCASQVRGTGVVNRPEKCVAYVF